MKKHSFEVYSEATAHLSTHWYAPDDSFSSVHINFYVPIRFLPRLVGEYSDRFAGSVQSCIGLLAQPLFGRETGERLELNTHLGGVVPLRYWVIRENNMPPRKVIAKLGRTFEQFVRGLADGLITPKEAKRGRYSSSAIIEYRRNCKSVDAQLELRLTVPATATKEQFEAFRLRAVDGLALKQEAGKSYLRFDEDPWKIGYGLFEVYGDLFGDVTRLEAVEELRKLFAYAASLTFPD